MSTLTSLNRWSVATTSAHFYLILFVASGATKRHCKRLNGFGEAKRKTFDRLPNGSESWDSPMFWWFYRNTYTQNHLRQLCFNVKQVIAGYAVSSNAVYPENIHRFRESDAVAHYYLIDDKGLHGKVETRSLAAIPVFGRNSRWPVFMDRLKKPLSGIPHWVNFDHDSESLKRAVLLEVLARLVRWQDLKIEDPGISGDFGVEYKRAELCYWCFHKFANSGDTKFFHFDNTIQVRTDIRTIDDSEQCFAFIPMDFCAAKDKFLKIRLISDKTGYL